MNAMSLKTVFLSCGAATTLLIMSLLTGCTNELSENEALSRRLYQAPILRLEAGIPVQTRDGVYIPQVPEVWHSPARFETMEREVFNLSAALQEAKSAR